MYLKEKSPNNKIAVNHEQTAQIVKKNSTKRQLTVNDPKENSKQ